MEAQVTEMSILLTADEYDSIEFLFFTNSSSKTSNIETNSTQWFGLLSQSWFELFTFIIGRLTFPIILVFGIVSNSLNAVVFLRIGLKDSVTSSFFALSLTDLAYVLCALFTWLCYVLDTFDFPRKVRLDHLLLLSTMYVRMILAASILITTYIAVQRCCCVALPMKFRGFFTQLRNTSLIALAWVVSVALYAPRMSSWGLKAYRNPTNNSTWYGLWLADNWDKTVTVNDIMAGIMLPIITEIVTVVCMCILIASLRQSSKFRKEASVKGNYLEGASKVSNKEIRVVKAVTFVTLMFILSNILPISLALARQVVPEFNHYQRYHNLFFLMNVISDGLRRLNASLNIFVYFSFNSAYRQTVLTIFRL